MRGDAVIDFNVKLTKHMLDFVHHYETRRAKDFIDLYDKK